MWKTNEVISMGLTDQQKLYGLPNYVLILKDDKIVGLMSCDNFSFLHDSKVFNENGYTLEEVNFDHLYVEGIKIQQQLGLRKERSWLTAQEYMQKLNKHRKNKYL